MKSVSHVVKGFRYLSLPLWERGLKSFMLSESLKTRDKWFGVTYKEDKPAVVASIRRLVDEGVYPEKLF